MLCDILGALILGILIGIADERQRNRDKK